MTNSIIFNIKKLLGQDRKKWPVTVRKYELYENNTLEEKTDRGRRIKNPETGNPEYEFLKEQDKTLAIPRKYLSKGPDGHPLLRVLKIQTEDGTQFAPIQTQLKIQPGKELEKDKAFQQQEVDMDMIIDMSRFIQIGKNELERHYEVTKTQNQKWYQAPIVWLLLGSIGIGIFYFMLGLAAQKATTGMAGEAAKNFAPLLLLKLKTKA